MVPRSATIDRSLSPSPLPPDSASEDEVRGAECSRDQAPRRRSKQKNNTRGINTMSMMDFLTVGSPESSTSQLTTNAAGSAMHDDVDAVSVGGSSRNLSDKMTANDAPSSSLKVQSNKLRRTSFSFLPRGRNVSGLPDSSAPPICKTSSSSKGEASDHLVSADLTAPRQKDMTARDFLHTGDASERVNSRTHGKGKDRHIDDNLHVPAIELKVMPVTDSVFMFGSTQTSSNYSLSGKVVVHANRHTKAGRNRMPPSSFKASTSKSDTHYTHGAGSTYDSHLTGRQTTAPVDFANGEIEEKSGDVDRIQMKSLEVVFSGYALYCDHSGRYAALKLANVRQEVLPGGATIPIPTKGRQEYDIEFNLSIPGWLPASLSTRFGGTFYCLEARAHYECPDSINGGTFLDNTSRKMSRAPSPASSSTQNGIYDSDFSANPSEYLSPNRAMSKEDSLKSFFGSSSKSSTSENANPSPTLFGAHPKGSSWLSKLQTKVAKSTSPGPASPTVPTVVDDTTPDAKAMTIPGRTAGSLTSHRDIDTQMVQSKAKVILIGRCREVVPVPLARIAIVGPEGLPEGAMQDLPPVPRSSSFDSARRTRSDTVTPSTIRTYSPPRKPPASFSSSLSSPLKAVEHQPSPTAAQPRTPKRASSAAQVVETNNGAPSTRSSRALPATSSTTPSMPMRHFLHRPMLHPPADAQISEADGGLPFSLTLTLPSHVSVDGPGSDVLKFGVQIEVGKSAAWSKVRELGGLRLRDMELSCIQTERHSSVASRTFCNSYPLPTDAKVESSDLPILEDDSEDDRRASSGQHDHNRLRKGYERGVINDHIELVRAGKAPHANDNNVERIRTSVVGPPPNHVNPKKSAEEGRKGKGREREAQESMGVSSIATSSRDGRRNVAHTSLSPSANTSSEARERNPPRDGLTVPSLGAEGGGGAAGTDTSSRKTGRGRGRRAYQSAIRSLSNLATAVMDISLDVDGANYDALDEEMSRHHKKSKQPNSDSSQTAIYSFAGADGNGVDLTKGRVRMAINLPLVSSDYSIAKMANTTRLIADFESPFIRARHKLKVKLGFGFGSKPLGGDGDGNWGQALVMCVPVRFTDAAPRQVREQFAPLPITQVTSSMAGLSPLPTSNLTTAGHERPLLPSYNQLFREDGSRLADEGEDLPQYPGPIDRRISVVGMPSRGSVTAPSPSIDRHGRPSSTGDGSVCQSPTGTPILRFDNRITPSRVVDESVPVGDRTETVARQQRQELEEMAESEEQEGGDARLPHDDETINVEDLEGDDDDDEFAEEGSDVDAAGLFVSSDQGQSGLESDYQTE
ncbi:hypothetical protein CBS101457_004494 [Exobasidium rhododendri]|nr:hypothetical protein CBS101457_004494 [Exobasidium rhododendri]